MVTRYVLITADKPGLTLIQSSISVMVLFCDDMDSLIHDLCHGGAGTDN